MGGAGAEDVERRVLELLRQRGPMSMEEIIDALGWRGDRRLLRGIIADMVRRGVLTKKPDYERRKMVFHPAG